MKTKSIEYRLKYEHLTGCVIEDDFDIHHIDFNRENNNIKNLVALPKKLHKEYHKTLNKLNNAIYNNKKLSVKELIKLNERLKYLEMEIANGIEIRDIDIERKVKNRRIY